VTGERNRQPVTSDYSHALGHAVFCFAVCEWNAVWCCERIKPTSLEKIVGEEITAGKIAKRFMDLVRNMPASEGRQELDAAASRFATLVRERNSIIHGKPCTGPSGEARLSSATVLEIGDLEAAADSFSACIIELNRLLYGFLASHASQAGNESAVLG
jgi:hypothetical protein